MRVKLDTVAILRQENGGEDVCESECRIRKGSLGYSFQTFPIRRESCSRICWGVDVEWSWPTRRQYSNRPNGWASHRECTAWSTTCSPNSLRINKITFVSKSTWARYSNLRMWLALNQCRHNSKNELTALFKISRWRQISTSSSVGEGACSEGVPSATARTYALLVLPVVAVASTSFKRTITALCKEGKERR